MLERHDVSISNLPLIYRVTCSCGYLVKSYKGDDPVRDNADARYLAFAHLAEKLAPTRRK